MLPLINRSLQAKSSVFKVFNSSREFSQEKTHRQPLQYSRSASAKGKKQHIIGKFTKQHNKDNGQNRNKIIRLTTQPSKTYNQEIRQIDKRIRLCKNKIEKDKKLKMKQQTQQYEQDFQKIIQKEIELHRHQQFNNNKQFDYLTNPEGKKNQQEIEIPIQQPKQQQQKIYSIDQGMQKLERFYENSLKKKFQRREIFPHKACKRKAPKLYITQKTNALNKLGKPQTDQQHKFRVFTKEVTPQEIYTAIPTFPVVKDNLSKNIVAYLGDYKPFIEKTKEQIEKDTKKKAQQVKENVNVAIKN